MPHLVRVVDATSEFTGKLCAWLFFAVGLFITYEIFVRNDLVRALLGTAPTIWVDEVSRIIQVWVAYLAPAYVLKNRGMITIEVMLKDPTTLARRLAETLAIITASGFGSRPPWPGIRPIVFWRRQYG